ncbi:hypothetical protein MCEMSEM29_01933 [Methylophilaceae bacterium]
MVNMNTFLELHYFSGGLKSQLFGSSKRPDWLPDVDLVGLHNDVFPARGEYVVEFSRHNRAGKLITWLGIYSYGIDDQFGDRANYNGVGVWLVDAIPIHASVIISHLRKICDSLVEKGPVDSVRQACIELNNQSLPSWIKDINILPITDNGIPFDTTSHPETYYIRADNSNVTSALQDISNLIERNCIIADAEIVNFSRLLYLLIDKSVEIKNIKYLKDIPESYSSTEDLINYFANSTTELKNNSIDLINQLKASFDQLANKDLAITTITEKVNQLEKENINLDNQNSELTKKINTKSDGERLEDLRNDIASLSLDPENKTKLLQSIDMLVKNRGLNLDKIDHSQNIQPTLNEIIRRLDILKINFSKHVTTFQQTTQPPINPPQEIENNINLLNIFFIVTLIAIVGFVAYVFLGNDKEKSRSEDANETYNNGISIEQYQPVEPKPIEFKITASQVRITSPTEIVMLKDNSAELGALDSTPPVYNLESGDCTLDGKDLKALPGISEEICLVKAIYNNKESEVYIKVDIPKVENKTPPSGKDKPKK